MAKLTLIEKKFTKKKLPNWVKNCFPVWVLQTILTFFVCKNAFFWDTVQLAAWHADFYYEHHFNQFWLPDVMDSGHPPIFGIYIALIWNLLGKSLVVSHFAMLPFLFGIAYQLYRLGEAIMPNNFKTVLLPLAIVNPVLVAQSSLVSPDVVLVFCFLTSINALFRNDYKWLIIGTLGLAMTSMRGMMCVLLIFLFDMLRQNDFSISHILKKILPYCVSGLFGILFLGGHYLQKGWIGYFAASSWAESFEKVSLLGLCKNIVVISWRLVDFGHLWCWLSIWLIIFLNKRNQNHNNPIQQNVLAIQQHLVLLLILSILILTPTALIYNNLSAHRYFLPIYLILNIVSIHAILHQSWFSKKTYFVLMIGLMTGHFWVYPQPIATGWDATLAHLPYYSMRQKILQYVENQHINTKMVGSSFPNVQAFRFIDLKRVPQDSAFAAKNFDTNQYIFYSNVFNDFSETEINILKRNTQWKPLKILKKGQVEVILYEKQF
ncbi:MAG: hypothetical protein RIS64_675 [Bacteroidota bacterium]|jgi:hypothetical protein